MAKRRGFWRRIFDIFRGKPEPRKPQPTPKTPQIPAAARSRERRAIDRMTGLSGFANRRRITRNVGQMTPEELDFVLTATDDELRNRARADADRMLAVDGGYIPLNPFWYR